MIAGDGSPDIASEYGAAIETAPVALIETGGALDELRFWAIMVLVALGLFFTFVSAVGVLRLPDVYSRAHTASQTDTLGAGMALAAVALAFGWQHASIYTVLLLFFVFITNPTAAHAIARSASETGIEPWTPATDHDGGVGVADTEGADDQYEDGTATDGGRHDAAPSDVRDEPDAAGGGDE